MFFLIKDCPGTGAGLHCIALNIVCFTVNLHLMYLQIDYSRAASGSPVGTRKKTFMAVSL